jgi:hypothetical protein
VNTPERKRLLARPRHDWEDNFKMDRDVEWIILTQDMENKKAFSNTVMI